MVSPSVVPQIGVLLCLRVVENPGRCAVAGLETRNGRGACIEEGLAAVACGLRTDTGSEALVVGVDEHVGVVQQAGDLAVERELEIARDVLA